jgi:hypothetical protein
MWRHDDAARVRPGRRVGVVVAVGGGGGGAASGATWTLAADGAWWVEATRVQTLACQVGVLGA